MSDRPLFQKRHYEMIAAILGKATDHLSPVAAENVIDRFAYHLVGTNPKFDATYFVHYAINGDCYERAYDYQNAVERGDELRTSDRGKVLDVTKKLEGEN